MTDSEVLRQVGTWEALGGLFTHPALGASRARLDSSEHTSSKIQYKARTHVIQMLGRSICVGGGSALSTRAGGLAWLDIWESMGWIDAEAAKVLTEAMIQSSHGWVEKWTFGLKSAPSAL